jgi:hypothetical protein
VSFRVRTSKGLQPARADASKASTYWWRSSLMIWRAAMLACAGELEISSSPPVFLASS